MKESVAISTVMDKLPTSELDQTLSEFVSPFTEVLPDARLGKVVPLAVRGIVAGESPLITRMAQSVERTQSTPWAAAKRIYRFLENPSLSVRLLAEGLYRCARATVEKERPGTWLWRLTPSTSRSPTPTSWKESLRCIKAPHRIATARRVWLVDTRP